MAKRLKPPSDSGLRQIQFLCTAAVLFFFTLYSGESFYSSLAVALSASLACTLLARPLERVRRRVGEVMRGIGH